MNQSIIGVPALLALLGVMFTPTAGEPGDGTLPETPLFSNALEVVFFDVGQGDCAVLITPGPNPRTIVIDGGFIGTARRTVVPFLRGRGISQIDLMILTHPDRDHINGLRELLRRFEVREVWDPGFIRGTTAYRDFEQLARDDAGDRFYRPFEDQFVDTIDEDTDDEVERRVVLGEPEIFGNVQIIPLHSNQHLEGPTEAYRINNSSIVVKVVFGENTILFTGDANGRQPNADPTEVEAEGPFFTERALLELDDSNPGLLQSTVLKVPHHGSLTSSSQQFVERVRPEWAIISSAVTNHRLPRPSTLARYSAVRANIIRTDAGPEEEREDDHLVLIVGQREGDLIWRQADSSALLEGLAQ